MTLDEYLYELHNQHLLKRPSTTDFTDTLYRRKYSESMPPLESYKFRQPKYNLVNVAGDDNRRAVFYGWNNITEHE